MHISKDKVMFILYVNNQQKSRDFYQSLLGTPITDVPGMTEFELNDHAILGLMPEEVIFRLLENRIEHPNQANGISRAEVYLYVDDPNHYLKILVESGGTKISGASVRSWGEVVAYGRDLDGHIIAFAQIK